MDYREGTRAVPHGASRSFTQNGNGPFPYADTDDKPVNQLAKYSICAFQINNKPRGTLPSFLAVRSTTVGTTRAITRNVKNKILLCHRIPDANAVKRTCAGFGMRALCGYFERCQVAKRGEPLCFHS